MSNEHRRMRTQRDSNTSYRVAVLSVIPGGMQGEVMRGFGAENDASPNRFATYTYFSLGTDPSRVALSVRRILAEEYDLILCIGVLITSVAYKLTSLMSAPPPIIFCLTGQPVDRGFIESMACSGNHLVGVESGSNPAQACIESFLRVRPDAGRVLLPYHLPMTTKEARIHDTIWYETYVVPFAQTLRDEKGITVEEMPFVTVESALDEIEQRIKYFDTLVLLEGSPLLNYHGPAGGYCSDGKTTLFACFRGAVHCSAAFGYAQSYHGVGRHAARLARAILFEGKKPSELESARLPANYQMLINKVIAKEQGADPEKMVVAAGPNATVFEDRRMFPPLYDEE